MNLPDQQVRKILKYWSVFETLTYKIEHFNFRPRLKYVYDKFFDDEYIVECVEYNDRLHERYRILKCRLEYFQKEYENYIHRLGYELNNPLYDETTFNLINNGIIV